MLKFYQKFEYNPSETSIGATIGRFKFIKSLSAVDDVRKMSASTNYNKI